MHQLRIDEAIMRSPALLVAVFALLKKRRGTKLRENVLRGRPIINAPQHIGSLAKMSRFFDGDKTGARDTSLLNKDIVEDITFVVPEPNRPKSKQKMAAKDRRLSQECVLVKFHHRINGAAVIAQKMPFSMQELATRIRFLRQLIRHTVTRIDHIAEDINARAWQVFGRGCF